MNDQEHMHRLYTIEDSLTRVKLDDAYVQDVVLYWLDNIAASKNAEYGTECWERLGPKALVVDISACYYRYEKLRSLGKDADYGPMRNAVVDAFGYAMLYVECTDMRYPGQIGDLGQLLEDDWGEWDRYDCKKLNEWLISRIWNLPSPLFEEAVVPVLVQPYRMWETLT